jgi:RNA polymerase sigma-70 factor (ECF subfamily)
MVAPKAPDLVALLNRYERPLVRYALSIIGDLESARDAVQETFIRLTRMMPAEKGQGRGDDPSPEFGSTADSPAHQSLDFTNENHVEAWLFTVCRHRAIDHQRKHSRIIPMPLPDDQSSDEPCPAAAAESRDTEASLLRLLDRLSPNQREVIRLKFQNDLSYQEIARVTQLSVTNVGFILHTGLKKLREIVRAEPDFADLSIRNTAAS